ncbi:ribosome small subunit-dependent GTPase A [Loktanella sp. TSTF-M6]|uniref:Small ribosomal subunit biogenesis GTPase RsgA n=1 Tax=Loktanella gaetbuli TaxID=2881335 RepID=A0ABS8BV58_9RHOB|nr:ribosome small subunit-dependent GTPase A [Loktanella gaetbuli]MCB5199628.1 ribosome small subunit-dependent GTPase A [Loktanella gaetbuli]
MAEPLTLFQMGWTDHFADQITDRDGTPARISSVHRKRVAGLTVDGPVDLTLDPGQSTATMAVGDWVLCNPDAARVLHRLDRHTTLQRGKEFATGERQLIAANLDTLFITTSCNADFNVARLERYLALAHDAGIAPVILLTKSDQADDAAAYVAEAQALGADLPVVALNAKGADVAQILSPWCAVGQTVAMAGSSGVGKTTIANALTGNTAATQGIREDDARGRHTTTGRSLHRLPQGGWLIDTPGMRGLGVADVSFGIDATFPEISSLTDDCRFRDCKHENEPGCAVLAAVDAGRVTADRLARYRKLRREDEIATETTAEAHARKRRFSKTVNAAVKGKKRGRR